MKFTLSWLKEHLETDAALNDILSTLTRIGLEVESVEDRAKALSAFTVAKVLTASRHPNADKLQVCRVATKDGEIEVVCGAPNARAGLTAVFAPVGSTIPASGMVLKAGAIRGVVSNGMLCSSRELLLGDDHDGIIELATDAPIGTPIAKVLGLEDPVIDIAITPNRGDCNGVAGIARDLAAAGLGSVKTRAIEPVKGRFPSPIKTALKFDDAHKDACAMFAGRLVRGVKNGPSPDWVQARLKAVGLRPISALVDVTNLISLEYARPLHVFDAATLTGDLCARMANPGESVLGLDGKSYLLDTGIIVIADQKTARGIAGVMGGLETGCTETTTDVFIEAALFDPKRIAEAGRKLAVNSDARYRFERGVDPEFCLSGLELATRLIMEWCGGEPSDVVIAGGVPAWRREISFDPAIVRKLAGLDVPAPETLRLLGDIGCTITGAPPFKVTPPSWRPDIHGAADLVEEIARLYGLDRIPSTALPRESAVTRPALSREQRRLRDARKALAARGMAECVTYSFVPSAHARLFGGADSLLLENPISADLDAMRPSIIPALLDAVARNAARGFDDSALFEVGPQFASSTPGDQAMVAAGVRSSAGIRHWLGKIAAPDVFTAKADVLGLLEALGVPTAALQIAAEAPGTYHPGRSGVLRLGPKTMIARFGELHPNILKAFDIKTPVAAFEVFMDALPMPKPKATRTKPPLVKSDFPAVERDFAFVVAAHVTAGDILRAAQGASKELIERVSVFDVYQGKGVEDGKKSVAIAVRFQPMTKTLTDAEIDAEAQKIVAAVAKATGATLRA